MEIKISFFSSIAGVSVVTSGIWAAPPADSVIGEIFGGLGCWVFGALEIWAAPPAAVVIGEIF